MLPHYGEEGVDATRYQSPASQSQTMPIRLVDYFVSSFAVGFVMEFVSFGGRGAGATLPGSREWVGVSAEGAREGPGWRDLVCNG